MSSPPVKKLDRYGWIEDQDCPKTAKESKRDALDMEKETKREVKWTEMISNWDFWMEKKRDKLAHRIQKGVPDALRAKIWSLLTNAEKSLDASAHSIEELLAMEPLDCYKHIKEFCQSLPTEGLFTDPSLSEKLEHVLCAYAQLDKEVGFVEGMGYIARMFLLYMDEDLALWAFHNTLKGYKTMQREYYTPGSPRCTLATTMLKDVIKMKYPKIFAKLESDQINVESFASSWFLNVFLHEPWPPEMMLKMFERFLFYGTRALLTFALVIISRNKNELLTMSKDDVLNLLMKPSKSPNMHDWRYLFKKWDELWISKATYMKLLKSAGAPPERLE